MCCVLSVCAFADKCPPPAQVLPASGVMKPYPLASRLRVSQITPFGIKLVADEGQESVSVCAPAPSPAPRSKYGFLGAEVGDSYALRPDGHGGPLRP